MALLTVVGEKLAKEGLVFVYMGPSNECRECKVKNICFHLEKGRRYKITGIRDVRHDCIQHEGGVKIVEVEKVTVPAALDKRQTIEGSTITLELPKCRNMGCPNRRLCFALGLESKSKYKVQKIGKKLECPEGFDRIGAILD